MEAWNKHTNFNLRAICPLNMNYKNRKKKKKTRKQIEKKTKSTSFHNMIWRQTDTSREEKKKKSAHAYNSNPKFLHSTQAESPFSRKRSITQTTQIESNPKKRLNQRKQKTHLKCNEALGIVRQLKGTRDLLLQFD